MKHNPLSCPPDGHFSPLLWSRALLVASFAASAPLALAAPVAMTGAGSYTQNFDTLPTTGTTNAWTDDSTLPAWYAQRQNAGAVVMIASNGGANSGAMYSFGTGTATERAIGSIGSGTPGNWAWGVLLQNTSASTLLIDSIAYTGEQWRRENNAAVNKLTFSYQKSGSPITNLAPASVLIGGWTAISALDFSSPIVGATAATALDGNLAANQAAITNNPGISVAAGEYVFLRWHDLNDTGSDHGLGIDNLTVTWSAPATPSLTVSATPTNFSESAGATASAGTVSIPSALGADLTVTLSSSDTTEATVPTTVTILTGQTSANFSISAVNDFLADGNQAVTIAATASGYLNGQVGLTVEEDSDAPISVSVIPSSFAENAGAAAATGTITIAENTVADLTVNLSSGDTTEATVPATATILAGTNSITFPVDAVNDTDVDGTRNVTIFATATGYTNGNTQIQVLDDGDTPPPPTIPVHGIAFTGYNADGDDNLAFVALVPIAAGDVIIFSDNEWNGSAIGSGGGFVDNNEGSVIWTAPVGGVAVGTVVTLDNLGLSTRSASVGTITLSGNFALAAAGDSVYAIQGAVLSPTRVLAAISTNTDSIVNTGLTDYVLLATGTDIGAYKGSRSNQPTYAGYLTQIHDEVANWVTQDTGANDGIDTVAPDVPFSSTAFTLAAANSYATWIAGYPAVGALTGPNDDFDGDGLDNAIENILGSDPSVGNTGLTTVSGTTSSVTFRHSRADLPATDLTASYEWSTDLTTWYPSGAGGGITVTIGAPTVITDGSPNDIVEVTATVTSGTATSLFVHLKATNP